MTGHTPRGGRHRKPEPEGMGFASPVDLERAHKALTSLGYHGEITFDRIVVPGHDFIATVWIDHATPLALVVDTQSRVPMELEDASALAEFLDSWNLDRISPTASYSLTDAGNIQVRTRSAVFIKCGLSDEQLLAAFEVALANVGGFRREVRKEFSLGDDSLPAPLVREQNHAALHGEHPQTRHLPAGEDVPLLTVPDLPEVPGDEPIEPFTLEHVVEPLDQLEFSYHVGEHDIVSTGVNGVGFALCIDGDRFFRVTGGWITDLDPMDDFLDVWLACNDFNEKSVFATAYTRTEGDTLVVHVETVCDISYGMALDQRSHFVISSLVGILSAMDVLSTQIRGLSIVEWPR